MANSLSTRNLIDDGEECALLSNFKFNLLFLQAEHGGKELSKIIKIK